MIWLRHGTETARWDGHRLLQRPPVLSPPPWALAARVWQALDLPRRGEPAVQPPNWLDTLTSATPRGAGRVVVVVPDATRVGAWQQLLQELLLALDRHLAPDCERRLLIATGTHAPVDAASLRAHLGLDATLLARWAPVQNSEDGFATHRPIGTTSNGTPVKLHPFYLDADFRIALADVSYHYFAGFGGGPKLSFPGMAEPFGAARNHRRAVESIDAAWPWRSAPLARAGELAGNPVHRDLLEAAELAPAHWNISAFEVPPFDLDPANTAPFPIAIEQGATLDSWRRAVERYDAIHRVPQTVRPKLLIVDAGGSPRDHTLLQAQKALQHAARFADPEARILLVAALEGGLGSSALRSIASNTTPSLEQFALDRPDGLHVQTITALKEVTTAVQVALWSRLDDSASRAFGFEPLVNEAAALEYCVKHGRDARWGYLPWVERFLPERGWLGGGATGARD